MPTSRREIYVAGGTGYVGNALLPKLLARGHNVRALARPGSESRLPPACRIATGDALDAETFAPTVAGCDTYIQLVGTPHPAPWKGEQFRNVDLASLKASVQAARVSGVENFIYVSVAQPAPIMKEYVAVRKQGEQIIKASGLRATILRPWYVLGPGHRWPYALKPVYGLMELIPATREAALRCGLLTLEEVVGALIWAVEHGPGSTQILDVPAMRALRF
jgi:uncharacterized protein YbjT (DUF2867 family)